MLLLLYRWCHLVFLVCIENTEEIVNLVLLFSTSLKVLVCVLQLWNLVLLYRRILGAIGLCLIDEGCVLRNVYSDFKRRYSDVERAQIWQISIGWVCDSNLELLSNSCDMWLLGPDSEPVLCPRWHFSYKIRSNWHVFDLERRVGWIAIRRLCTGIETHMSFNESWHCFRQVKPNRLRVAVDCGNIDLISYRVKNWLALQLKCDVNTESTLT